MKKSLFFLCLLGTLTYRSFGAGSEPVNLGLVSQLVELKYVTEGYLFIISGDTAKTRMQKDSALINYNDVRIQADRIIYQLTAEMLENNSVKIYARLNKYYAKHRFSETGGADGTIMPYVLAFKDLCNSYKTNILPGKERIKADLISAATMLSVVNTSWTILKGVREQHGKKVDGIIEILNNLRLNAPTELSKGKK